MAATGSADNAFTFVKGLVTEGGFFVHPKDAWKEGFNVTPLIDGSVERREGFDFEENHSPYAALVSPADKSNWAYVVDKWEAVNGDGNLDFFVVQVGPKVYFYDASTGTVSARKKVFSVDLTSYGFTGRDGLVGSSPIKAVAAYGKLVITNRDAEPILVIYDKNSDNITVQSIELTIRDFDGIRSPVPATQELTQAEWTALNFWPQALYNLYNQGWTDTQINAYKTANGGRLPANSKQWIYGKDTSDNFDAAVLAKQDFGSMVAPKGRMILKAFYQDRASASNLQGGTLTPTVPSQPWYDDNYQISRGEYLP